MGLWQLHDAAALLRVANVFFVADYNASPGLERVRAALPAINSADDERNPPELAIMERGLKRIEGGRLYLIPAGAETHGHGTTALAPFWKQPLFDLLQTAPRRAP